MGNAVSCVSASEGMWFIDLLLPWASCWPGKLLPACLAQHCRQLMSSHSAQLCCPARASASGLAQALAQSTVRVCVCLRSNTHSMDSMVLGSGCRSTPPSSSGLECDIPCLLQVSNLPQSAPSQLPRDQHQALALLGWAEIAAFPLELCGGMPEMTSKAGRPAHT